MNRFFGKSPVITDGEFTLAESGAIIEYLVARYGAGRLARGRHTGAPALHLLDALGPVNAIYANANGVKTAPIKARDDAQTGRLG